MDWLNLVVLIIYIAIMFGIAFYTRKKSKTLNDFLLGGRGVSGLMTAFAYGTTYFSAVIFIGYAGQNGYTFGLAALWIGVGNAIIGSLIAWKVLAKRTRRLTHFVGARTMPELFEKRYDSKYIKLLTSIIIFIFLVPYAASVYQGLGYLFEKVFSIPFWAVVLIMAGITGVYLFFGGYFATVITDFFQGIIMLVGVFVMVYFVVNYETINGLVSGLDKLFADGLGFFPPLAKDGQPFGYSLLMQVLLTSFGVWGLPQIVHKFHTIRNEKSIKQAMWVSSGFALVIGIGAYFVGCFARYAITGVGSMPVDQIIPELLVKALPAGLLGLIVVLVMSASMSTLAGLTLASSSAVSVDLVKGYIKKDASDKTINLLMRLLCLFFIAVSVVIAVFKPSSIINLMSLSWGTLAGCFIAPYVFGLYMKKATKTAAFTSIFTALGLTAVLYIISKAVPSLSGWLSPPAIGVASMALTCIVMPIVSLFTKPPKPELLNGMWHAIKTKEDDDAIKNELSDKPQVDTQSAAISENAEAQK